MTIQLKDVVNAVILPRQRKVISLLDETSATETAFDMVLAETNSIKKTELVTKVVDLLDPVWDLLSESNSNPIEDRVCEIITDCVDKELVVIEGSQIKLLTDNETWSKGRNFCGLYKEFGDLLTQISRLRNLM